MVRIEILRNTVCGGVEVYVGNVVEASDADAKILIRGGKAEKTNKKITGSVKPTAAKTKDTDNAKMPGNGVKAQGNGVKAQDDGGQGTGE